MKNIVIIYGGRNPEHDISVLTGLHCAKHITDDYIVRLVYITKGNRFVLGKRSVDDYISGKCNRWRECRFSNGALYKCGRFGGKVCDVWCVVNCCHGGSGENGELSGLMNIAGIPFTSCDPVPAYNQQSKSATREILSQHGFAQPAFQRVKKGDAVTVNLPVIVKPDLLGSSIGITVAKTEQELAAGLELAFTLGDTAVAEEYLTDVKEVNIAVMRRNGELVASAPEAVGGGEFFSFDEKYLNTAGGFLPAPKGARGDGGAGGKIAGREDGFTEKYRAEISEMAINAYKIFESSGVVRSDFLVTPERIILNENNTVPGFLSYHLFLKSGVPYGVVIDDIINDAVARFSERQALKFDFGSEILDKNRILVEK